MAAELAGGRVKSPRRSSLLIIAGLMIRSFYKLQQVNPGFSHERLTSFSISLPQKKYATEEARQIFLQSSAGEHSCVAGCRISRRSVRFAAR